MGLKKKQLRTDADLTPKQKMFVEILVQDHGSITQGEALKRAGYVMKEEKGYTSYASQLLSRKYNPHVAAYYDKRFEKSYKNIKVTTSEDIKDSKDLLTRLRRKINMLLL